MFAIRLNFSMRHLLWALAASLLLHAAALWSAQRRLAVPDELLVAGSASIEAHLREAAPTAPRRTGGRATKRTGQTGAPAALAEPQDVPDRAPIAAAAQAPAETVAQDAPPPVPEEEAVALPAAVPDVAWTLPRQGRIRFAVLHGMDGFEVGQAVHEWRHDGATYVMTGTTEATGLAALLRQSKAVQTSEGSIRKGELQPREFRNDRGGNVETAAFDWERQVVGFSSGQEFSIAGGAQDVLSMFYQLTQAGMRGAGFQMAVATGRKLERYAFDWLDEEDLTVRAGRFRTWHVRIKAASGGGDSTEVWLGQEVAGLPVKIRHTDRKGQVFDQIAEQIEYEGK